jgi:hypothetical protein
MREFKLKILMETINIPENYNVKQRLSLISRSKRRLDLLIDKKRAEKEMPFFNNHKQLKDWLNIK